MSDLLTRIHESLDRVSLQIDGLRQQVDQVLQKLESLGCRLTAAPGEAQGPKVIPPGNSGHYFDIPVQIQQSLEHSFQRRPNSRTCPFEILQDITDAINTNLQISTVLFQPELASGNAKPPPRQYACVLKCVFLLKKAKESSDFLHPRALSHWPSYIRYLDEVQTLFLSGSINCFHSLTTRLQLVASIPRVRKTWPSNACPPVQRHNG